MCNVWGIHSSQGIAFQSFRASVAQDADFASAIPEAAAWLGFSTRRNPLFLPSVSVEAPRHIGLDGTDMARLRVAQNFALQDPKGTMNGELCNQQQGTGNEAAAGQEEEGPSLCLLSGSRARRDKIRAMDSQIASVKQSIQNLEGSLHLLQEERERRKVRAEKAREAAAEAGQQKLAKKMYRLRGTAAFLEQEVEELSREITAVRVRLFAEQQVVCHPARTFISVPRTDSTGQVLLLPV